MTRWTSTTNETEAARPSVVLVVLCELDFVGGVVRAHDGIGELTHAGQTYYGLGKFGGIELDVEDQEVSARSARLILSGVPADHVPDVLLEDNYQNRTATLYIGILNPDTGAWVDTPEVLWDGLMDYMTIETGDGDARIVLHVEDELRREPLQAWYTDEDQQLRFSGDRFFSDLLNVEIYNAVWGQKPASYLRGPFGPGGGGGMFEQLRNRP